MSKLLPFPIRSGWCVIDEVLGGSPAAVRRQAQEIIDDVLRDADPEKELNRAHLQRCIANHPGRPDEALLEHLLSKDKPRNSRIGAA